MKILSICSALLFALPSGFGFASTNIYTGYEFGEREIAEILEERESLGNFDYFKYRLRLKQTIKNGASYSLSYHLIKRDFETQDSFDSKADDYKLNLDMPLLDAAKIGLDFGHKEKRYGNSPASEYNRDTFSLELKHRLSKMLALGLGAGITNYDYRIDSGSNQSKYYAGLNWSMLLLEEKLNFGGFYQQRAVEQKGNKTNRSEQIIGVDGQYNLKLTRFKKVNLKIEHGRNDTKEIEERDDALRYRYNKWNIKTMHPLSKKLDTTFGFNSSRRDYFDAAGDFKSWAIDNETVYSILESKISSLDFSLQSEHKETSFHLDNSLDYSKDLFSIDLTYKRKKNYKISANFKFSRYDYPAKVSRKEDDFLSELKLSKEFAKPALELQLRYAYKYRDFHTQTDAIQWWINLGMEMGF
ncbi:MAG: hypothetical protein A3J51_00875 [Omnitrophica WOR_2 bacterium RIFCSPHIGHO2_02_FULL_45_21]|nr:MAG: hypothetical protein A3J51_00875 [Omnitrophica WOR_2 bacterium RIFCSPHIGHO2_02_FULL_45_21]